MNKMDLYEVVTQKIIDRLEGGVVPWQIPWRTKSGMPGNSYNACCKINTSVSFHGLSKVLVTFNLYLNIELSSPSFSTAILWIKKIGYGQLQSAKEKADDWIIIRDERIGIEQEKVLVILRIRRSYVDFSRPLMLQDMESITVKSKERWKGQDIAIVKEKLGAIIYAVTDIDSTIKYGLNEVEITQVIILLIV